MAGAGGGGGAGSHQLTPGFVTAGTMVVGRLGMERGQSRPSSAHLSGPERPESGLSLAPPSPQRPLKQHLSSACALLDR